MASCLKRPLAITEWKRRCANCIRRHMISRQHFTPSNYLIKLEVRFEIAFRNCIIKFVDLYRTKLLKNVLRFDWTVCRYVKDQCCVDDWYKKVVVVSNEARLPWCSLAPDTSCIKTVVARNSIRMVIIY